MIGKIFIKLQKKPYRKNIGLELIHIIIQINGDTLLQVYTGSQHGRGQYHKNCYTKKKLISIFKHLNFIKTKVSEFRWQGKRDFMIRVISFKK